MTIYDLVTCCRAKGILYIVFGIQMSTSPRNMLQGNPVQEATLVLRLGGRHVTEQLMNQVKVTTYYIIITLDISITIIISIIFLIVITVTSMIKSCSFLMIVNQSHPSTCSPLFDLINHLTSSWIDKKYLENFEHVSSSI